MPPLYLITIAALAPRDYPFPLAGLNCGAQHRRGPEWADIACFPAMPPRKQALRRVAALCREAGELIVFSGPQPSSCPEECALCFDVPGLEEGEFSWRRFIDDLERGKHLSMFHGLDEPDTRLSPVRDTTFS